MKKETYNDNFIENLSRYIGETVTIFTQSGGESGYGFTGVIFTVNKCFVRLITQIGPAPGDAASPCYPDPNRINKNYYNGCYIINNVGSITDIPINKISSFVHNAI